MFCGQCGTNNADGARFCAGCGAAQAAPAQAPPPPYAPPPTPPVYAPPPPQGPYAPPPAGPYGGPQPGPYGGPPQVPYGAPPQGPYGAPAPVGYGAPGPGMPPPANIPTHFGIALLTAICCCQPVGVMAVMHARNVKSKLAAGDWAGAQESSKKAMTWSMIAVVGGILLILYFAVQYADQAGL